MISEVGKTYSFDAVGRQVKTISSFSDTFYYDGDGRLVSQTYIDPNPIAPSARSTYYLWSSVLKENLAQIRLYGQYHTQGEQKQYYRDVFIYVNGQQVARREYDLGDWQPSLDSTVHWIHRDPLNTIARSVSYSLGNMFSIDPLGVEVAAAFQNEIDDYWTPAPDPNNPPEGFYQDSGGNPGTYGFSAPNPGNWGLGCYIDGIQTSCERAFRTISNGSAWGVTLSLHGAVGSSAAPIVAGVRSAATSIDGQSTSRVRYVPKTIPGDPNGLTFKGIPEADLPSIHDITGRVAVYESVGAMSGEFVFSQGGAAFGSLIPNVGFWTSGDGTLRTKFDQVFTTIQNQNCKDFVNGIIAKNPHSLGANFEDLLKAVTFHLYNPDERAARQAGIWSSAGRGGAGHNQLKAGAEKIGQTFEGAHSGLRSYGGAAALTLGKNIYISAHHLKYPDVNAGVLIVHEILHAAGIKTRPSQPMIAPGGIGGSGIPYPVVMPQNDHIKDLEPDIKKHCAPNLPGN